MYINFSDSAKFASIAKNLVDGLGFGNSFSFWAVNMFEAVEKKTFLDLSTPPVMPLSIAAFFKIFGVGDFAVIATSIFYFVLSLIFIFLLAKKIFKNNLIGILSVLAVGSNYNMITYAINGASELPFIFGIVAAIYFATFRNVYTAIVSLLFLIFIYFTRAQAFIYIAGTIFYLFLVNFRFKKALILFIGTMIVGLLVDYFILSFLVGQPFLYSVIGRGLHSSFNQTSAASDVLRGSGTLIIGAVQTLKNVFYNLYNFYKLMPQIVNPYLFTLFVVGLFRWKGDKVGNSFKLSSLFMVLVTFLVTALSIPFFRYIHPIIPLVYIIAIATLSEIIVNKKVLTFLVLLFSVGQTLGIIFLDSRFERSVYNVDKAPVYVELSKILKDHTTEDQAVITNLDTWGSWYGERKTIWFPLEPKQIINPKTGEIPFDAIYLTSYLINDENYYMGTNWRIIFENPENPKKWICDGCVQIAKEFKLNGVYKVSAKDTYENQDAHAILLIRK